MATNATITFTKTGQQLTFNTDEIKQLQSYLISQGADLGPRGVDGDYGRLTRKAFIDISSRYSVRTVLASAGLSEHAAQLRAEPKAATLPPIAQGPEDSKAVKPFEAAGGENYEEPSIPSTEQLAGTSKAGFELKANAGILGDNAFGALDGQFRGQFNDTNYGLGGNIIAGENLGTELLVNQPLGANSLPTDQYIFGQLRGDVSQNIVKEEGHLRQLGVDTHLTFGGANEPRLPNVPHLSAGAFLKDISVGEDGRNLTTTVRVPEVFTGPNGHGFGGGVEVNADNNRGSAVYGRGAVTTSGYAVTGGAKTQKVWGGEEGERAYGLGGEVNVTAASVGGESAIKVGGAGTAVVTARQGSTPRISDETYIRARYEQWIGQFGTSNQTYEAAIGVGLNPLARQFGDYGATAELAYRRVNPVSIPGGVAVPGANEITAGIMVAKNGTYTTNEGRVVRVQEASASFRGGAYFIDGVNAPLPSIQGAIRTHLDRQNVLSNSGLSLYEAAGFVAQRHELEAQGAEDFKKGKRDFDTVGYNKLYGGHMKTLLADYAKEGRVNGPEFTFFSNGGYKQLGVENWRAGNSRPDIMAVNFAVANPKLAKELIYSSQYDGNPHVEQMRDFYKQNPSLLKPGTFAKPGVADYVAAGGLLPENIRTNIRLNTYDTYKDLNAETYEQNIVSFAQKGRATGKGQSFEGQSWKAVGFDKQTKTQSAAELAEAMAHSNPEGLKKAVAELKAKAPAFRSQDQQDRFDDLIQAAEKELKKPTKAIAQATERRVTAIYESSPGTRPERAAQQVVQGPKPSGKQAELFNAVLANEGLLAKDTGSKWTSKSDVALEKYLAKHGVDSEAKMKTELAASIQKLPKKDLQRFSGADDIVQALDALKASAVTVRNNSQVTVGDRFTGTAEQVTTINLNIDGKQITKKLSAKDIEALQNSIAAKTGASPESVVITDVTMDAVTNRRDQARARVNSKGMAIIDTTDNSTAISYVFTDSDGTKKTGVVTSTSRTDITTDSGLFTLTHRPTPSPTPTKEPNNPKNPDKPSDKGTPTPTPTQQPPGTPTPEGPGGGAPCPPGEDCNGSPIGKNQPTAIPDAYKDLIQQYQQLKAQPDAANLAAVKPSQLNLDEALRQSQTKDGGLTT